MNPKTNLLFLLVGLLISCSGNTQLEENFTIDEIIVVHNDTSQAINSECKYVLPFEGSSTITQGNLSGSHIGLEVFSIDFDLSFGDKVLATRAGKIINIYPNPDLGNATVNSGKCCTDASSVECKRQWLFVAIEHTNDDGSNEYSMYAHLSQINVKIGQDVVAGQVIGLSGKSGLSSSCSGNGHLHYQVQGRINVEGNTLSQSVETCFQELKNLTSEKEVTSLNKEVVGPVVSFAEVEINNNDISDQKTLDRHSISSVINWFYKSIEGNPNYPIINIIEFDTFSYSNHPVEGGQLLTTTEFIEDLEQRFGPKSQCDLITGSTKYQFSVGSTFTVWTSGWNPQWEMEEICYGEGSCEIFDPPLSTSTVGFDFFLYENGWGLSNILLAEPSIAIDYLLEEEIECEKFLEIENSLLIRDYEPIFNNVLTCLEDCNGNEINSSKNFPEKSKRIYFEWDYTNVPKNSLYERVWSMDGKEWARYSCSWDGLESGVEKITLSEPAGLASGSWKMEILINGVSVLENTIIVDGNWDYWDPAGYFSSCYGKK